MGLNLGENACLLNVTSHSEHDEGIREEDVRDTIDLLVDKLADNGDDADDCSLYEDTVFMEENHILSGEIKGAGRN